MHYEEKRTREQVAQAESPTGRGPGTKREDPVKGSQIPIDPPKRDYDDKQEQQGKSREDPPKPSGVDINPPRDPGDGGSSHEA